MFFSIIIITGLSRAEYIKVLGEQLKTFGCKFDAVDRTITFDFFLDYLYVRRNVNVFLFFVTYFKL